MAPSRAATQTFAIARVAFPQRLAKFNIIVRNARTQTPPAAKSRTLAKPDRWRPPSHPARLPRKPQQYPGAPLTEAQKQTMAKKQYPNMFPPEGSFMFWFLTNRSLHVMFSMGLLILLASFMWFEQWRRDLSPVMQDLLPSKDQLPWHPFRFMGQFLQVYKLRTEERSREVDEKRHRSVDDALKRAEYRKQHGIKSSGLAARLGLGTKDDDEIEAGRQATADIETSPVAEGGDEKLYSDNEGRRRKEPVKKWFGIWS